MRNRRASALVVGLWILASAGSQAQSSSQRVAEVPLSTTEQATVIYLLRHAEAELPPYNEDPPNPSLNDAGHARARELAHVLAEAGVTRVLSSDFKRTRETAEPLVERLALELELYDPRDLAALASTLRATAGRYVVVGHSNTTPRLVELLGGEPGKPIDEVREFDRLYIVVWQGAKKATTVQLRYGEPPAAKEQALPPGQP